MNAEDYLVCPHCQAELELNEEDEGKPSIICPACGEAIKPEDLPPIYTELVTVYTPADEAEHLLVQSVLEEAGIRYYSKNALVQNLFGLGTIGTGYNVAAGLIAVQVHEQDAERATMILESYFAAIGENPTEVQVPAQCPACGATTDNQTECPGCGLVFVAPKEQR